METGDFYFKGPHPMAHSPTACYRWSINNWKERGKRTCWHSRSHSQTTVPHC